MMTVEEYYDEAYFERGVDSGKNSMSGAYSWDRLRTYFCDTAAHLVKCFGTGRMCDFGCAKGLLVRALRSFSVGACGIDCSHYAVKAGNAFAGGYLECHDLTKSLPPTAVNPYAPINVLTCFDMMEHIEESDIPMVFENMLRFRPRYIVMNICVPPEDGYDTSHVTIRPREYWLEKMWRYLPGYHMSHCNFSAEVWWFNKPEALFVLEENYENPFDKRPIRSHGV